MTDTRKTKKQLIDELNTLRKRIAVLEQEASGRESSPVGLEDLPSGSGDLCPEDAGADDLLSAPSKGPAFEAATQVSTPAEILCIAPAPVSTSIAKVCRDMGHHCTCVKDKDSLQVLRGPFQLAVLAVQLDGDRFFGGATLHDLMIAARRGPVVERGLLLGNMEETRGHMHAHMHRASGYCETGDASRSWDPDVRARIQSAVRDALSLPPYEPVNFFDHVTESALHSVVESSQAPLFVLDQEWRVWFANLQAHALFRRSSQLLKGLPLADLLANPEEEEAFRESVTRGLSRGGGEIECRLRTRLGCEFDALIWYNPIYDDDIPGLMGFTFSDITRRKQAEARLARAHRLLEQRVRLQDDKLDRAAEELGLRMQEQDRAQLELARERNLLQTLIDNLPDDIYAKDREHRFVMVNRTAVRNFGAASADEIIGRTDADFFAPALAASFRQEERELMTTGAAVLDREAFTAKPGQNPFWTLVTKVPLRDRQTGRIVGLVGLNRDISHLKRVELEMLAVERQYRLVLDAMTDAVYVIDRDSRIVLFNQAFVDWLGHYGLGGDPQGRSLREVAPFLPEDSFEQHRGVLASEEVPAREFEVDCRGSRVFFEIRKIPLMEGEQVVRVLTILRDVTKRKEMEESLLASEARIRQMVNSLPIALFSFEAGTNRILLVQGDVRRMFGYEQDHFLAHRDLEETLVHPDDLAGLRKAFRVGLASMRPFDAELRIRHAETGAVRHMHQYVVPVGDAHGRLLHHDSVVVDITERKATEQALRESEARIRQVVDSLPIVLGSFEVGTGRVLLLQGDTRSILGYEHEQLISDPHLGAAIVHPEDQAATYEAFARGLASMRPFSMAYRIIHGQRLAPVHLQRYVVPVTDSDHRLVRHDSIIIDVTAERESQQRLKLLSQVVEQTSEGVGVAEINGKVLFLNGACAAMHGGTVEDYLGKPLSAFHAPKHMTAVNKGIRQALRKGEFEGEIWHSRKDGSVFPSRMHVTVLRDESNKPVGLVGLMRDITIWKEMQAASARLAEAVKNAGEGIAIWDENWSLTYANAAMCSILGWDRFEGLTASEAFGYMSGEGKADAVDVRIALRRSSVWRGRIRGRRRDGSIIPLAATFSRLRLDDGTRLYVGNVRDTSREEAQLAQIRRLGREAAAQLDQERARISKELHDELGQQLTVMNMGLAWFASRLAKAEEPVRDRLSEMQDLQQRMTQTVRGLAKSLRPALLDYQLLGDALRSLVAEYSHAGGITCNIKADPKDIDVENPLKTVIYRIAQEALTNVVRHSGAKQCRVEIIKKPRSVQLRICDNGIGSKPTRLEGTQSLGIIGMKERAAAIGGKLSVESMSKGGVCVMAVFPQPQPGTVN